MRTTWLEPGPAWPFAIVSPGVPLHGARPDDGAIFVPPPGAPLLLHQRSRNVASTTLCSQVVQGISQPPSQDKPWRSGTAALGIDDVHGPIADAARGVRDDVIVLCHGGPIAMPEDAQFVLSRTNHVHGFYGASSMERLPVETALTEQVKAFKAIRFDS